jgi:hypothetical protein
VLRPLPGSPERPGGRWDSRLGGPAPTDLEPVVELLRVRPGFQAQLRDALVDVAVELGLADPQRDSGKLTEEVDTAVRYLAQLVDSRIPLFTCIEPAPGEVPGCARDLSQEDAVGFGLGHGQILEQVFDLTSGRFGRVSCLTSRVVAGPP